MEVLKKITLKHKLILALVVLSSIGVVAWWNLKAPGQNIVARLTVALPTQVGAGAFYVATRQNGFARQGLEVSMQPFILGRQALQSVLQGKADLAVVADTPFMFAVMRGEKIAAVASIFGSRRTMAIVARKDRGINRVEDLKGKTVGTMFGTNAQYFVDTLLLAHAVEKSAVTIADLKPETVVDALKSGEVDAVSVWNPDLARLQQLFGDRIVTIYDESVFVYRFLVVGKQEYIEKHQDEVRRVIVVLDEATRYIHDNPLVAQTIIGEALAMDTNYLTKSFNPNDYYLTLDQTLLLALSDQTRWAFKQGLINPGPVPNYLHYIRLEPFEAVLPDAIKIIR